MGTNQPVPLRTVVAGVYDGVADLPLNVRGCVVDRIATGVFEFLLDESLPEGASILEVVSIDTAAETFVEHITDTLKRVTIFVQETPRSQFFPGVAYEDELGNYATRGLGADSEANFSFHVDDFGTQAPYIITGLTKIQLLGILEAGTTGPGKQIDLLASAGLPGVSSTLFSNSQIGSTFNLGAGIGDVGILDLSTIMAGMLFPSAVVGLKVTHNAIGGEIQYLGINFNYTLGFNVNTLFNFQFQKLPPVV